MTGNGSGNGNSGTSTTPADPTPTQPSTPTTPTEPAAPTPASGSVLNPTDHIAYVKGYDDGTVRPDGSITRAETATMLYRLLSAERRDAIFTADNTFSDVAAADWFNKAVSSMSSGGYIRGYEDGTFLGNRNITRAEFVTILSRFTDASAGSASFTDVPDGHWAKNSIAVAAENGWVNGYEDGTFQPDKAITRAEAMTMINRFLNRGVNAQSRLGEVSTFSDNSDASAWYYYEIIEATNDHEYTGARPSEQWTSNTVSVSYDMDKYERP